MVEGLKPSIGKVSIGLGHCLFKLAKWMLRHGLSIRYYAISASELEKLVKSQIGCPCWLWDGKYWFTDSETWKKIISKDFTEQIKYLAEKRDCDNISAIFKAHISEYFDMNGVGITVGEVKDSKTNQLVGYHAWNTLICQKRGKPTLYFLEPQLDLLAKAQQGVQIGEWKYYAYFILWY